jgi:hypothetical protein
LHIAGTGKDIEHLPCLSYCTKQRIIAPLSLLLFVEADRCAFGLSGSAQNRSVEIKRHPNQTEALESCKHHLPAGLPKLEDALVINAGQGPADRRNVRQLSQPQKTKHHKIVSIIVHIPKPPITQHQVHDQCKNNDVVAEYRAYRQMVKTATEPGFHIQPRNKYLNDDMPCKSSESLILETKLRHFVDTGNNLCFAKFHFRWPPALVDFASLNVNFNQSGGRVAQGK